MITTETIHSTRDFSRLSVEWNDLLADSGANTLFLTWEWLFFWWLSLAEDRKLCIIAVRRDGRLIALAPLALRPWRLRRLQPFRTLEFLGCGSVGSDYLNFIVRRGCEELALPAIMARLRERRLMLQLSHVERLSLLLGDVLRQLDADGWNQTLGLADRCPYVDLSMHTRESYLSSLTKSHRGNFRRGVRQLNTDFRMEFAPVLDQEQRGRILREFMRLHLGNWDRRGGSNALHTAALQRFHDDFTRYALDAGWLRLFSLTLNGHVAGVIYCLLYNDKYYFYQLGYDPTFKRYSLGHCLIGLAIDHALGEEVKEFDFLRGDEAYKYLWANAERALVRLDAYPPDLRGRLAMTMMGAREEFKRRGLSRPPPPLLPRGG